MDIWHILLLALPIINSLMAIALLVFLVIIKNRF